MFSFSEQKILWSEANFGSQITSIKFSASDDLIILGDISRKIRLWNAKEKSVLTDNWVYHSMKVNHVEFNSTGKYALSSSLDGKVYIWNVESLAKELEIETGHKDGVLIATFSSHNTITTSGGDSLIKRIKTSEDYF